MNKNEIEEKINRALSNLYEKDKIFLENRVNERTVSAKLACYLEKEFPDYSVDVEYNRHGVEIKTIKGPKRILPDIVIHKRGSDDYNLLAIEIKIRNYNKERDEEKLKYLTKHYKYKFGLFIKLESEIKVRKFEWFKDGEKID